MIKWAGKIVLLLMAIIVIWVVYFWITYTDDVITDGEAYGFTIGNPKKVVFESAPKNLSRMTVYSNIFFTDLEVTEEIAPLVGSTAESKLFIQTRFHPSGYEFFKGKDLWVIYFEGSYNNFISFKFCDNKLCEIRRHRQYFDLP